MNRLFYILSFLFIVYSFETSAQGQNNQWCFGQKYGLNFNTVPPSFFQTNMRVLEGSSSVSDHAGNLLFYSSGANNWDRNGNLMPNGQGLNGNGPIAPSTLWPGNVGSSAEGVVIIPSPSNSNQYYVIVTDAIEDQVFNAYYSVVDMTLNGGLGDVIPTQKNILLTTDISEGVLATTNTDCSSYWVILHSRYGTEYRAFKIDNNGVSSTSVLSYGLTGNNTNPSYGGMRFSNNGTKMVRGWSDLEMSDFNKSTGVFSSFFTLQPAFGGAGYCAFSPDDSKLYFVASGGLGQYNLSLLPNVAAMEAAVQLIDTSYFQAIRLGLDNKIYLSKVSGNSISIINNPNMSGTACQLSVNAMLLPNYTPNPIFQFYFAEFGSQVPYYVPADTFVHNVLDTTVCFEQALTLNASGNYQSYQWFSNAVSQQETVNHDGIYWVKGWDNCNLNIDSFHVHFTNFFLDLGADTGICEGSSIILDAAVPDAIYKWQDYSSGSRFTVTDKGTYKVNVSVGKCSKSDSIVIDVMHPFLYITAHDTIICKDEPFILHGIAYPESSYMWNTGDTTNHLNIKDSGTYSLMASNVCGDFYDSVRIAAMDCFCNVFVPNAFSPNGDGDNEIFKSELNCPGMTTFTMSIFNRFGQRIFESNDINKGWDGYYNNKPADLGTYFYYIQYKDGKGALVKKKGDLVLIR